MHLSTTASQLLSQKFSWIEQPHSHCPRAPEMMYPSLKSDCSMYHAQKETKNQGQSPRHSVRTICGGLQSQVLHMPRYLRQDIW